jgi:hypothetical protein
MTDEGDDEAIPWKNLPEEVREFILAAREAPPMTRKRRTAPCAAPRRRLPQCRPPRGWRR